MKKMEIRTSELKLAVVNDEMRVSGVVNKPGQWSHLLGARKKFRETICEGVFERALEKADKIDFLADHNSHFLLASTTNNSLQVQEQNGEVRMEAVICPTSYGRDYFALMQSGLCNEMSFGFIPKKDRWQKQTDGTYKRWIEEMEIVEVTACRFGAYGQSEISARGIEVIDDPNIPSDEELIEAELRALDDETFEGFKTNLKAELLEEVKTFLEQVKQTPKEDVQPVQETEVVIEDEPTATNEAQETEEVTIETVSETDTKVETENEAETTLVEAPTPETEPVKTFDVSAYLEAIETLKNQKTEV